MTDATTSITAGSEAGSSTLIDAATIDSASATSGNGASGAGGIGGSSGSGIGGSSEGGSSGSSESGSGGSNTGGCQDAVETEWATSCPTSQNCTSGAWQAPPQGSDGHPYRDESEHFAIYWYDSDPDGSGPLLGVNTPPSASTIDNAFTTLESIWDVYFGDPIYFPEPYCDSSTKWKAAVLAHPKYENWTTQSKAGVTACKSFTLFRSWSANLLAQAVLLASTSGTPFVFFYWQSTSRRIFYLGRRE